jgi:hypothetical protein
MPVVIGQSFVLAQTLVVTERLESFLLSRLDERVGDKPKEDDG